MGKLNKTEVHVRAYKTRIIDPKTGKTAVYRRGHVFKKPWPELIALAKADKDHKVLALIETKEKEKAEEIKHVNE